MIDDDNDRLMMIMMMINDDNDRVMNDEDEGERYDDLDRDEPMMNDEDEGEQREI
jgi:hypothetical protein